MPTPEEINSLIEKFEETIRKWPKNGGLFIDLMGEKLKQIEKGFITELATQLPPEAFAQKNGKPTNALSGETEVYVALYQMDGDNMDRWAMTLSAIAIQGISRPIYASEADVCSMIRAKEQRNKEGYAVVKLMESDIVKSPSPLQDRFGKKLIHVKPGSLKTNAIVKFVHISGQYAWKNGKLIKLDARSPILEITGTH